MSGAVEGVDRAKAMLLGDEDTQGIRPHVTFADPAYNKQRMIDFALPYAAPLTAPPARTYADEDVARIIDPYAWRCYDATLRPFQENRGAHEGENWHVRAYQAGCRSADDARLWWRETANDVEPYTVQQFRDSLAKAAAIRLLSQGEKA